MSDVPASAPVAAQPTTTTQTTDVNTESATLDAQEAASEAANPSAAPAAKAIEKQLKKLKLKVDGEEYEESFDPNDDAYLTKQFQLAKMAQKRGQSYSELEKGVLDFIQELKTNPRKALADPTIGVDVKQLAREILEEEIENARKSPEQLEKERIEAELKALKEEREQEKQSAREKELQTLEEKEYLRYDQMVDTAITEAKLPRNPYVVKKMADLMLIGLQNGIDVEASQVANIVKDEMMVDLKELMGALPEEVLEEFIGKEILNKMRKRRLAKTAAPVPQATTGNKMTDIGKKGDAPKSTEPKKTFKDFFGI